MAPARQIKFDDRSIFARQREGPPGGPIRSRAGDAGDDNLHAHVSLKRPHRSEEGIVGILGFPLANVGRSTPSMSGKFGALRNSLEPFFWPAIVNWIRILAARVHEAQSGATFDPDHPSAAR
jgi:hypothetical protein